MTLSTDGHSTDPVINPVKVHEGLYWKLFWGAIGAYLVLLLLAVLTWNVMILPYMNVGFPIALLVVVHFISSWGSVDADEWAAFYFYGRALRTLEPGPYFMPKGLMQIRKVPKDLAQFQAPGEPEEVFHGDNKDPLPPGMVRPIRITTREPNETEKGHLDVQMTFEWSFYVQFQILDFFQFIASVGSFEHAKRLIRDTGEAVLNEFASDMTVNGMIKNLKQINRVLDDEIRKLTNRWAIQIFEAKALAPDLSHTLATELRNVPVERLKAEQTRTRAAAERERLEQEGAGMASAKKADLLAIAEGRKAFLTAEADGLKAKKDALGIDGEHILVGEVASDAFKNANSVMVGAGDGVRDLMGMLAAGKSVLEGGGKANGTT